MEVTCTTFFLIALANFLDVLVLESVHMANRFACVASVFIAFLIASTIYFSINRRNDPLLDRALGVDTKQYVRVPDFRFRLFFTKPMGEMRDEKEEAAPIYYIGVFILLIQSFLLVFITLRQNERGPSMVILLIAAIVHFFEPTSLKNFPDPQTWAGVSTSFYYDGEIHGKQIEQMIQLFFRLYVATCTYSIVFTKFLFLFREETQVLSPYKHCLMVCILCTFYPVQLLDFTDAWQQYIGSAAMSIGLYAVLVTYAIDTTDEQICIVFFVFAVFLIIFKLNAVVFDKKTS